MSAALTDLRVPLSDEQSLTMTDGGTPAVLKKPHDLPAWRRVLTHQVGLPTGDLQHVALVETTDGALALIKTPDAPSETIELVLAFVRRRRNTVTHYQATADLVTAINAEEQVATLTYRGEQDRVFDELLAEALRYDASDIHLQVRQNATIVQYRIHGHLHYIRTIARARGEQLSRAIYTFADADSKQVTWDPKGYQDASITREINVQGRWMTCKIRFASMPVYPDGWDIVLRLLPIPGSTHTDPKKSLLEELTELGFTPGQRAAMASMLRAPTGAIIICGATGAGKSTTLAALARGWIDRHHGSRCLRTIEDPPEHLIIGRHGAASQHPVVRVRGEEDDERPFARALRAAMRADPDAIAPGEVRDQATAVLCARAVQTGHKVFATVHATDPYRAIERLIELGAPREEVGASGWLTGIIYQTLVPELCRQCAVPLFEAPRGLWRDLEEELRAWLPEESWEGLYLRGPGCDHCNGHGYRGRTVAAEIVVPDREVCSLIATNRTWLAEAYVRGLLATHACSENGRTVVHHVRNLVREGRVSLLDADRCVGRLDVDTDPEQAKHFYQAHRN